MRKLKAIVLAGILSVTCAFSVSAASGYVQIVGNTAYDSNGGSYQAVGNNIFGSDGSHAQVVGNQIYYDEPDDQDQDQDDVFPYLY